MSIPYGINKTQINCSETNQIISNKFHTNLSFKGIDFYNLYPSDIQNNSKKLYLFYNMILSIESKLLDHATKNSITWFNIKNSDINLIKILFNS